MSKKLWTGAGLLALLLVLVPSSRTLLAQAPEALTVFVNGYGIQGKALWYKGKIYVPLEDVARSTGGAFSYDPATGTARATIGGAPQAQARPREARRPYLKVVWERKYTTGGNARVLATVANRGNTPAENVQAICIFKDETLQELTAQTQSVGRLAPGESRTLEFQLFANGGALYAEPYYPYYPGGALVGPFYTNVGSQGEIFIGGQWQRVSYELKFNYE